MAVSNKTLAVALPHSSLKKLMSSGFLSFGVSLNSLLSGFAGAVAALGFAPYYLHWLSFCGVALGAYGFCRNSHFRESVVSGVMFGAGLYVPSMFWLYAGVDHTPEHLLGYFAPSLLIVGMIIQSVVMSAAMYGLRHHQAKAVLAVLPGISVAFEFARHHGALAFPWLSMGYAQIPDGPLAGYAPLIGTMGVAWVQWIAAGCIALIVLHRDVQKLIVLGLLLLVGSISASSAFWTEPNGRPISVALLQGNVRGDDKFKSDQLQKIIGAYDKLMRQKSTQLVVMPETAWPVFDTEISDALEEQTQAYAMKSKADVLVSHLKYIPNGSGEYFAVARNIGISGEQLYIKRRLVPFGEYVPFPWLFRGAYEKITKIKLLDTAEGPAEQPMPIVAGHRAVIKLCYEDLFPGETHEEFAMANFLVGMVNDDWFDSSVPLYQHLQVSQARAIESEKPYVRAGNTGVTALIDERGHVVDELPTDVQGVLSVLMQPRYGQTPYSQFGDSLLLVLAAILALGGLVSIGRAKNRGQHVR